MARMDCKKGEIKLSTTMSLLNRYLMCMFIVKTQNFYFKFDICIATIAKTKFRKAEGFNFLNIN